MMSDDAQVRRNRVWGAYVNTSEDLRNRIALLGEFTINRSVTALDTMAHAQKLMVISHASDLQVSLASTHIDYFF
jgi:hypothetical protein